MKSLSAFVREAWVHARALPPVPADLDPRTAADTIAEVVWGPACEGATVLYNVAGLALASRERVELHEVRSSVARVVAGTDLHAEPAVAPLLLERPWIAEAHRWERGERLFGDTWALGCYQLVPSHWYLVGLVGEDAYAVKWCPLWRGGEIALGVETQESPLVATEQHGTFRAWARDAARWALVYSLLLEADRSPLETTTEEPAVRRGASKKAREEAEAWRVSRVRVTDAVSRVIEQPQASAGGESQRDGIASLVRVCGHLKRQPHGPERSLRKWVWVEGYEARRWLAPGAIKKVVS